MKDRTLLLRILVCILVIPVMYLGCLKQKELVVKSPDGKNVLTVFSQPDQPKNNGITFTVQYQGRDVILPSILKLTSGDIDFSMPFTVNKVEDKSVENEWDNAFGERRIIPDNYNQVIVYLESSTASINLICRAYNEGVAFKYEIPKQDNLDTINIDEELITYNFSKDYNVWSTPKREGRAHTAQGEYRKIPLSQ